MGRRINKPKPVAALHPPGGPKVTSHDNLAKEPLTDEQRQVLTDSWSREYGRALTRKKTADADLKNVCTKAKSEGVLLKEMKDYLACETEEGQAKLRVDAERITRIARWRNFALGHQFALFEEEGGGDSRSFTLGKETGMAGNPMVVPTDCARDEFIRGWHEGQAAKIMSGIAEQPTPQEPDTAYSLARPRPDDGLRDR